MLPITAFATRWAAAFWIAGLLASGAIVETYWSVSSTVLCSQTAITATGTRMQPKTAMTTELIRRARDP